MAEVVTDFKKYIETLVKKYHLEQMTPGVKARFDKYAKNKDFIGNMKNWEKDLAADVELDDAAAEAAYKAFLAVFENMAENTDSLNKNVKTEVFDVLFGPDKVFNHPDPIYGVKDQLDDFAANLLTDENEAYFTKAIEDNPYILRNFDDNQFDYGKFRKGVQDGKYVTDPKFRRQVISVVRYVASYPTEIFPDGSAAARYKFDRFGLPQNPDKWFVAHYNPGFRAVLPSLIKRLTVDAKFRDDFKKNDHNGIITGKVEKGLEKTAYDDPKSADYISPVYQDKKRFGQRVVDGIKKFEEDNLDSWGRILTLRGTRKFFSPYAETVITALSKVKVKEKDGKTHSLRPTDGLQGFIDNKEAILAKIGNSSPNAKKHFEWFVSKMELYSKNKPAAFKGALRNADQLLEIVAQLNTDAIQSGKDDEIAAVNTSMEILSNMKYGVFHSRFAEAMRNEDLSVASDKNLSWNKYDGVKFVTGAIDKTVKFAILGAIYTGTAIRNGVFNLRTKFRGNTKFFKKAQEHWKKNHNTDDIDAQIQRYNAEMAKQNIKIKNAFQDRQQKQFDLDAANNNYNNFVNAHGGAAAFAAEVDDVRGKLWTAQRDLSTWLNLMDVPEEYQFGTPEFDDYLRTNQPDDFIQYEQLKNNWQMYQQQLNDLGLPLKQLNEAEQNFDASDAKWNQEQRNLDSMQTQKSLLENSRTLVMSDNSDKFLDQMAIWDMLETHWKTHQFTLSASRMRKKFLEGYKDGTSKAQQKQAQYIEMYRNKYQNVA